MVRATSLSWRIFIASILLMPVVLGFSAYMLERALKESLITAEHNALLTHTYSMMALAEPDEGFLLLPERLTDSRFNDPESGLYAQVIDEEFGPIWQSISLDISALNTKIPVEKVPMGDLDFQIIKIGSQDYFISRFNTVWEIEEQDREYQFSVVHSQKNFKKEVLDYRTTLVSWLIGLAIILIFIQTVTIRWGLFPLRKLAGDIKQLESGRIEKLDSDYPTEILPVTKNINHLIDSESTQRKRYKNTLSDLAHSLKTPLTVIRSSIQKSTGEYERHIDEQVERMNNIITHQLNRASSGASKATFRHQTKIFPLITRIHKALAKVYQDKGITFTQDIAPALSYAASEDDLMELLGNLLENAFKYGNKKVYVNAEQTSKQLTVSVSDDGPGVAESMRQNILERGARADTSTPGQGIGLAVTTEIISTYDGALEVETSDFGGARFTVFLPHKQTNNT
ncbi:MAG: GHKL domain-containing protein [Agarilytica sp.]